jgi:endonuclease YncB( thermonuclease family)
MRCLAFTLVLTTFPAPAETAHQGKVVKIADGDTLTLLVAQGFARVYRKYSDDAALLKLEAVAEQKGLGLWADPNPIPPWEWRRGRRTP